MVVAREDTSSTRYPYREVAGLTGQPQRHRIIIVGRVGLCLAPDLVCMGQANADFLDSYAAEREFGADENIRNSSRTTDFMTPKSDISRTFRNAVLDLAARHPFARPMVNSGRLSVPCTCDGFPHFGVDALNGPAASRPESTCPDARLTEGFLLDVLGGGFAILSLGRVKPTPVENDHVYVWTPHIRDVPPEFKSHYLGSEKQGVYLIRPDQNVVARWGEFDVGEVRNALHNALKGSAL